MQTRLFDYHLPEHLIARVPAARRDRSRLMVINRASGSVTHTEFANLPDFLPQGARLFRNNATVLRARLRAQRPSGGQVECLLLRPAKPEDLTFFATDSEAGSTDNCIQPNGGMGGMKADQPPLHGARANNGYAGEGAPATDAAQISPWDFICLLKPGRRLKPGETFYREGHFSATVLDKHPDGENRVRFTPLRGQRSVVEIATLAGDLPLPPYIEQARAADAKAQADGSSNLAVNDTAGGGVNLAGNDAAESCVAPVGSDATGSFALHPQAASASDSLPNDNPDNERYQTVYADPLRTVAAAAPTAGLHFSPELLARLAAEGVPAYDLTLHVGLDTFRPITADTIEQHQIHRELYEIPPATLEALKPLPGRPRVAIGTTTLRSIEHYCRHHTEANTTGAPWIAEADIFIYPPAHFAGVEALITNFHLPKSTLLCLVSAFLTPGSTDGIERLKELYGEAIARQYRFFSYGDAMLIL